MDERGCVVSEFGARLRALRDEKQLTQVELAERAGLPVQRVFKIEQGNPADPRWSTVCKLAAGLGVEVGAFVVGTTTRKGKK